MLERILIFVSGRFSLDLSWVINVVGRLVLLQQGPINFAWRRTCVGMVYAVVSCTCLNRHFGCMDWLQR